MVIVIKLAIFLYCIRHALTYARPSLTASIYAGAYLAIGLLFALFQPFTALTALSLGINFLFDLGCGFLFFWLIDRSQDNVLVFYSVIVMGIIASITINLFIQYTFAS